MKPERIIIEQRTLDFISKIELLTEGEVVCAVFEDFVRQLGFSSSCCLKIPEAGESIHDGVLMNSRPEEWSARYVERDYVRRDPMVLEMFRTFEPYAWSDVLQRRRPEKEDEKIVYEASEFGMTVGYVVPIFGMHGYTGVVSVAGDGAELPEHVRSALQLGSIYVHNKLLAVRLREEREKVRLTPRERECLQWAAGATFYRVVLPVPGADS